VEIAIVGPRESVERSTLLTIASRAYLPQVVLVLGDPSAPPMRPHPLLEGRLSEPRRSLAYVCVGGACRTPAESGQALRTQLAALHPSS
jgi:uncharacterized protein YyaL (SSP411 family)